MNTLVDLSVLEHTHVTATVSDILSVPDTDNGFILAAADPAHIITSLFDTGNVHFISSGKWNLYDMLMLILQYQGFHTCRLYLSTFSISEFAMRTLAQLKQSKQLSSLHVLLNSGAKARYPAAFQIAQHISDTIALRPVHAKVMVVAGDDAYITICGSANWTENPKIEQGLITNNSAVGLFHIDWLTKAIAHGNIFE